jgi:hypothetical protein
VLKFRHEIVRAGAAGGETSLVEAFEAVARRESHCSSGRRGGDLGHFARGKMQPPFEHAAFELKVRPAPVAYLGQDQEFARVRPRRIDYTTTDNVSCRRKNARTGRTPRPRQRFQRRSR